jgi:hypothetical protein
MSWLVSFIFAGLMFTSQSNAPIYTNEISNNPNAPRIVQLDETERFEQSYPFNPNGKISVSNVNGSITVTAWDKNEIKLEAVKIADSKERLADVQIKIDAKQDSFSVETDYGSWKNNNGTWKNKNYGKLEVQYTLMVPRTAILDEIETVNGSVTISNMVGRVNANAVNGNVKATNLRGAAEIETVNGVTEADFDSLENTSKISLSTVNGQVRLVIPSDADATIKAETVNGRITNDFGLPVRKEKYAGGRNLYGKVGNGDAKINLESVNGELSVLRKQDGKTVKPAVNLLNEKSDDDDDDGVDMSDKSDKTAAIARADRAKRNAEVEKAVREANVEAAKAMKEAQKELEKAKVNMVVMPKIVTTLNTEQMKQQIAVATKVQAETLAKLNGMQWNWTSGAPIVERKTDSFMVKGQPKVTVDAKNCKVFVRGWDKSEVQYSIVKLSKGGERRPLDFKVDHTDSDVTIKINDINAEIEDFNGQDQIRVEVFVPKKSNLRILTSREIRVEGVSGDLNLTGEEESINIRNSDGKLTVVSKEGNIRVIGFNGEIDTKSSEGTISLEGDFQKLNAQTTEGSIILTLPENANATFQSNAEINAEGFELVKENNKWRLGDGGVNYHLQTNEGQIFVRNLNEIKNTY